YYVYDARTQTFRTFEASSRGTIPPRMQFGVSYRARPVLSGGQYPNEIVYGAQGSVTDWDAAPARARADQAVIVGQGRARVFPDIVRGMRAHNDDVLFVWCDGSVWRQMGDPMLGGEYHQVMKGIGLASTWAHCFGPDGALYFLATDGHVYRMAMDGSREKISDQVRARFLDIDHVRYAVELHWDIAFDGVWMVLIPKAEPVADALHYFWCKRMAAWHPVQFGGGSARCVTAVGMRDGDRPDDRATLFAFADGTVAATHRFATDDAGVPIRHQTIIGQLVPSRQPTDTKLGQVGIALAHGSSPVTVGAFASTVPDVLGEIRGARVARAGRGLRIPVRARGSSLFLGVGGVGRMALEELHAQVGRGGQKQRSQRRT
ncbi:MAG: hypothetical protein AAFP22_07085, partial [Planctomycetota bacterium]